MTWLKIAAWGAIMSVGVIAVAIVTSWDYRDDGGEDDE
jgi:hypothetical protein